MRDLLEHLLRDQPLTEALAEVAFERIFRGQGDEAQIGALLALIQRRGPTVDELVGAARVMRRHARIVSTKSLPADARVLDTCGTGGAPKSFNVSTVAAIIVAAAAHDQGVHVAKHGNRSRTGRGSAEVLAKLGVNIDADTDIQARCLSEVGVCFCFAIHHHPAARHAAGVRQSLGVPTIFNLLGPLTNPAGAPRQLLGVFNRAFIEPMAQALVRLGSERAIVAHSADGLDEISTTAETFIAEARDGTVCVRTIDARDSGLKRRTLAELQARDLDHAAEMARAILSGDESDNLRGPAEMALLNAAAALMVTDAAASLDEGLVLSRDAIASGRAERKLAELAHCSQ